MFQGNSCFMWLLAVAVGSLGVSWGRWLRFLYCLTIIDRVTRWPEVAPLKDISEQSCAEVLCRTWMGWELQLPIGEFSLRTPFLRVRQTPRLQMLWDKRVPPAIHWDGLKMDRTVNGLKRLLLVASPATRSSWVLDSQSRQIGGKSRGPGIQGASETPQ